MCGHDGLLACETTVQYCLRCSRWLAESSALLHHQQPANAFFWCCWSSAGKAPYAGTGTRQREQLTISEQQYMWHFIVCWRQYDTDSSTFWVDILKLGHFSFCIVNVLHFDSSPISDIMRFWVKILTLRQLSVCILKNYHLRLHPIKVPTRWSSNIAPRAMSHRLIIHW